MNGFCGYCLEYTGEMVWFGLTGGGMMNEISHDDLLACAVEAARTAGDYARSQKHRVGDVRASFEHDVKLELDFECQQKAREVLLSAFPDHSVLGEEDPEILDPRDIPEYQWIVDPIDGTVNFSHGMPFWCCSIAVREKGKTVAGTVYGPDVEELYTATTENKATCNEEPISVSQTPLLNRAMIATGVDQFVDASLPPFAIVQSLAANAQKIRVMGSAALDLCRVATGMVDGYFEAGIYLWDVAAAQLIVEQAGGKAEILHSFPEPYRLCFAASNGLIHEELTKLVDISSLQRWTNERMRDET